MSTTLLRDYRTQFEKRQQYSVENKMITYDRLWETMKKKGISQYRLQVEGISNSTLTRLKHNEPVTTETIDKLCRIIGCPVEDMMEYKEKEI